MAVQYRVVDLRTDTTDAFDIVIEGVTSPEEACRHALGVDAVRSGHCRDLVAQVYFQMLGQPLTMVRLYGRPPSAS